MPLLQPCHISKASALLRRTLSADALDAIARKSRFVRRERVITAASVFWSLMVTLGSHPTRYISDVLRTLNGRHRWSIRYKPFWNRLAKRAFAVFMKSVFENLCREIVVKVLRQQAGCEVSFFSEIYADDGSSFAVADGLRRVFPGRFTKVTPAAIELHAHMSLLSDNLLSVALAPDKEAERAFLPAAKTLPRRSLSLRDRGYIDTAYFEALEGREAYLICRAKTDMNPTVVAVEGLSSLTKKWRGKKLKAIPRSKLRQNLVLRVSWPRPAGRTLVLRLVVRYIPERKSWTYLLTNVPERFDGDTVAQLYRLRWQIELLFKDWKSNANLHAFETEDPAIVEGFIWASLCAAFIKRALVHWAQYVSAKAMSTRIGAMAGPQVMPLLATCSQRGFCRALLDEIFDFLRQNAVRTHPKRDRKYARHTVGLRFAGASS